MTEIEETLDEINATLDLMDHRRKLLSLLKRADEMLEIVDMADGWEEVPGFDQLRSDIAAVLKEGL